MSFIKNAVAYSGTNLVSQAAMFVQAFILRMLLIPQVMGVWNFVQVVRGYVAPISLGAINGAFRELPILKGQGKQSEATICRSVSLSASLAEAVILALGIVGYTIWQRSTYTHLEIWAFIVAAALVILTRFHESCLTFFQGAQLYVPLSRILLINGLIFATILPVGALAGGLPGLLVAALTAAMIRGLWMISSGKHQGLETRLGWDKSIWKRLVSFGIGYRLTSYPMTLFLMLDLLWVTRFMDLAALALYATARNFFLQASDISVRIGTVFFTRILEDHGRGISKQEMGNNFCFFIQMELLVVFPLVCWAVSSVFPLLVRQFIPLYVDSIPIIFPLMIAGFFIPQNHHLFTLWVAEKKLIPYGISNVLGLLAVGLTLIVFWYILGLRRLQHVALAALLGYAIHFTYMMTVLGRKLFGRKDALKLFCQVILAAGWTGLVLLYSGQWCPNKLSFTQDVIFSLQTGAWTITALLPLIGYGLWVSQGGQMLYLKLKIHRLNMRNGKIS